MNNFLSPDIARETAFVTTTLFRNFNPESKNPKDIDSVRGRLALQTLDFAKQQDISIILVDDGSSPQFRKALSRLGLAFIEGGKGMGEGRRISFLRAMELPGIKYILWSEPEKTSLIRYCLPLFITPLVSGEAEMVVANRDLAAFKTYPDYQLITEIRANKLMNKMIKKHGLWPEKSADIDFLFAPRFYLKNSRNKAYLTEKFESTRARGTSHEIDLDKWPASIVIPVIRGLFDGKTLGQGFVTVVELPYQHPKEQTESEIDSPELAQKRLAQYNHFVCSASRMVMYLEGNLKSGIRVKQ